MIVKDMDDRTYRHATSPGSHPTPRHQDPDWSPQIRENNPLDFSVFLSISGCNMQILEGDFSGGRGAPQLPESLRTAFLNYIVDFEWQTVCNGQSNSQSNVDIMIFVG
jgi:hypothetical protein